MEYPWNVDRFANSLKYLIPRLTLRCGHTDICRKANGIDPVAAVGLIERDGRPALARRLPRAVTYEPGLDPDVSRDSKHLRHRVIEIQVVTRIDVRALSGCCGIRTSGRQRSPSRGSRRDTRSGQTPRRGSSNPIPRSCSCRARNRRLAPGIRTRLAAPPAPDSIRE